MNVSPDKWVIPFHGVVEMVVPTLFLQRCSSPSNVDDSHVRISLARIPSLERLPAIHAAIDAEIDQRAAVLARG